MIVRELPAILPSAYEYMDEVMDVEATMLSALKSLPPVEFADILHPVFQEDEIKLIVVRGVLGAVAGIIQQLVSMRFFDWVCLSIRLFVSTVVKE